MTALMCDTLGINRTTLPEGDFDVRSNSAGCRIRCEPIFADTCRLSCGISRNLPLSNSHTVCVTFGTIGLNRPYKITLLLFSECVTQHSKSSFPHRGSKLI